MVSSVVLSPTSCQSADDATSGVPSLVESAPVEPAPVEPSSVEPSPVEQGVLLTLVYSDLFDFPLTAAEIKRYLPLACSDSDFDQAFAALESEHLEISGDLVALRGRGEIFATRRRRAERAAERWRAAQSFTSWLEKIPFLRMIAVCGSQAVENGGADGDVDLFLVTAPGRLWLVQSITMILRRLGQLRFGIEICPNYLVTLDRLEVEQRNLYIAREIAQIVPLRGGEDYERFLAANRWLHRFLPRLTLEDPVSDRRRQLRATRQAWWTRGLEHLLGGLAGHLLDRGIHRLLLLYYRLRLWRRGWSKSDIEGAYEPDRQSLITGGYGGAIAQRFVERARQTLAEAGHGRTESDLRHFYFGTGAEEGKTGGIGAEEMEDNHTRADPHFFDLFTERYGRRE